MNWRNLRAQTLDFETVKKEIAGWAASTARPFAGMPRPTEPGYKDRMRRAYDEEDMSAIANEPGHWPQE